MTDGYWEENEDEFNDFFNQTYAHKWIIAGGVASSITLALGEAIKYAYENEININSDSLKSIFEM